MTRLLAYRYILGLSQILLAVRCQGQKTDQRTIDISGKWQFRADPADRGETEKWYGQHFYETVTLPGSMTTNGKGEEITVSTPWTGSIFDSSWFNKKEYAKYREPGHIKIPFWLQPSKYYTGAAWYRRTVTIPASWREQYIGLFLERCHWETRLWVDDHEIGMNNSLAVPQVYDLSRALAPGVHHITIRIDNRIKDVNVGLNSSSLTDHTQTNWNGVIGRMAIMASPPVHIGDVQVYPDPENRQIVVWAAIRNSTGDPFNGRIRLHALLNGVEDAASDPVSRTISDQDSSVIRLIYPMGAHPLLWDEFHPNLYTLHLTLTTNPCRPGKQRDRTAGDRDEKNIDFGMRRFSTQGTQFTINGRITFLRGTLECAIFPRTGYPSMDIDSWLRTFRICRSYGLNHMRFHSWCPPEAAFAAADRIGFYLQIEIDSWANWNSTAGVGDGRPLDRYLYEESDRIVRAYGNHPSFCMMAYGNEPAGKHLVSYLTDFVNYWKQKDPRRLYTTAAGWPVVPESDYNSTPAPRIQHWEEGLRSILNRKSPRTDYDWRNIIAKWDHPTVSHEIGQWCAYPDFKEIKKYTGILKANNFEIFRDQLNANGLGKLADSFLLASGKLQTLCYKADIEAALRTPGFGGFQLLQLDDFPGQGTALVGVLNAFWEEKGYTTGRQYSQFCNSIVPLVRFPKMVWLNNESVALPVEVANFGAEALTNQGATWEIKNDRGGLLFNGRFPPKDIPIGNGIELGVIRQSLTSLTRPEKITLTVTLYGHRNHWELFVYPATPPAIDGILVTQTFNETARRRLAGGGKVLLTLKKGALRPEMGGDIAIGFSSIFWNTSWTHGQPPVTLGILCDPAHPALKEFPTEYYSNYEWWDAMSHSCAIRLDSVAKGIRPIVRVIDDWVTANSLGILFECAVGKGKLLVSCIDLLTDQDSRPEARQLLFSLEKYMTREKFHPSVKVDPEKINDLFN